jgi:hypothetical protein
VAVTQVCKGDIGYAIIAGYRLLTDVELDGTLAEDVILEDFGVLYHVTLNRIIYVWFY